MSTCSQLNTINQATIFLPFPKSSSSRKPTTKLSLFASRLRLSKAFFSLEQVLTPKTGKEHSRVKEYRTKFHFFGMWKKPFLYIEYRILSKHSILQDHPDKNVVSNFCRSLCPQKWTFLLPIEQTLRADPQIQKLHSNLVV